MISSGVNTRELILEILLQIEEEGEHSHIAIRNALSKYQFLPKQERSFITRVCEGTLEYRIYIDYVIDSFSKVSVNKMKPQIREILRSAVYQLKFMDSVPDSGASFQGRKRSPLSFREIFHAGISGRKMESSLRGEDYGEDPGGFSDRKTDHSTVPYS